MTLLTRSGRSGRYSGQAILTPVRPEVNGGQMSCDGQGRYFRDLPRLLEFAIAAGLCR
ncbi:hypothetical protein GALMADRAFT_773776 [Galerina marginata CBS 339.88]|uniref:Uncharacterized protein n=1 Tax=Galerina marginata (strain CBS 339.88) TaxID=685588 RepID=A0A067SM82_GALM3|nr:hypothetical protein GALMADRAFT_773776 [Galerina marginata CBS 339.88]